MIFPDRKDLLSHFFQNMIFFSGLIFSGGFLNPNLLLLSILGYVLLCIQSGNIILLTVLINYKKKKSVLDNFSRWINIGIGVTILELIIVVGVFFYKGLFPGLIALLYTVISVSHDLFVKDLVIIDVLGSGIEFTLKAALGAALLASKTSLWLLVCAFLLALLVSLGQRRNEIKEPDNNEKQFRKVLTQYTPQLLDQMMAVVTSSTILAYSLYTISSHPLKTIHTTNLVYTIPFVLYGIMRFIYLVHTKTISKNIELELIRDKPLIINFTLWLGFVLVIMILSSKQLLL